MRNMPKKSPLSKGQQTIILGNRINMEIETIETLSFIFDYSFIMDLIVHFKFFFFLLET